MKRLWPVRRILGYVALLAGSLVIALVAGWTEFAARIDNYAYDTLFNAFPPRSEPPQSAILSIDEPTFNTMGGPRKIRSIVAASLERLSPARPAVVAVDVLLADASDNRAEDERLARAMAATHNLVLPCELIRTGWEDPILIFRPYAVALGHVHADESSLDGISREIPLEKAAAGQRRWSLSLEAFHFYRSPRQPILESPQDVEVGDMDIPAPRSGEQRPLRIRYQRSGPPMWSVRDLMEHPALAENYRGKAVFIGQTALSNVRDRLFNPYGEAVPGIVIHQQAFETMAHGRFFVPASNLAVVATCMLLAAAAGVTFAFLGGWYAYGAAALLLGAAHLFPVLLFRNDVIFPYFSALSAAWLGVTMAGGFHYFVVRRAWRKSESDKVRYQQAIHFVTHEMRTPLTAIQGSSELMGRYNLTDEKRKQIANMINSESKRLARMIQTFLDVERLSEGEMELKRVSFAVRDLIRSCVERVRPVAERKQIAIQEKEIAEAVMVGDRELMEYAFYNLLTNAVKYSPALTEVTVTASLKEGSLRLSVLDQGIGMDAKELKSIFRKFYRTKRAEASGEAGTGIGLSIVEQIVTGHGGRMEVASTPGKGSVFTMVVPAQSRVHSEDIAAPHAG